MAKIKTNIMEIVLREILIGKTIYDNNGIPRKIDDINLQPSLGIVYIKSGGNGFSLSLQEFYDFELDQPKRNVIVPTNGRIKNL